MYFVHAKISLLFKTNKISPWFHHAYEIHPTVYERNWRLLLLLSLKFGFMERKWRCTETIDRNNTRNHSPLWSVAASWWNFPKTSDLQTLYSSFAIITWLVRCFWTFPTLISPTMILAAVGTQVLTHEKLLVTYLVPRLKKSDLMDSCEEPRRSSRLLVKVVRSLNAMHAAMHNHEHLNASCYSSITIKTQRFLGLKIAYAICKVFFIERLFIHGLHSGPICENCLSPNYLTGGLISLLTQLTAWSNIRRTTAWFDAWSILHEAGVIGLSNILHIYSSLHRWNSYWWEVLCRKRTWVGCCQCWAAGFH
jgi:hypothetical protein